MIADIFGLVIQQKVAQGIAAHIGAENVDYAGDDLPRMVWVPGIDTFRPGKIRTSIDDPSQESSPLRQSFLTRVASVKVHLWAKSEKQKSTPLDDIRAMEDLLRRVLVAVRNTVPGNFTASDFLWSGGRSEGQEIAENGRYGILSLSFEVPIYRTPEEEELTTAIATTETQTGTMAFPVAGQYEPNDADIPNLLARWKFNDATQDLIEEATWPLVPFGDSPPTLADGLIEGTARVFAEYNAGGANGLAVGASDVGNSNCTFSGWVLRDYDGSSTGFESLFMLAGYGSDETEETNRVLSLLYDRVTGVCSVFWEHDAGVNALVELTGMVIPADLLAHNFALVKRVQDDGNVTYLGYVDGQLLATATDQVNSTGGTAALWWFGSQLSDPGVLTAASLRLSSMFAGAVGTLVVATPGFDGNFFTLFGVADLGSGAPLAVEVADPDIYGNPGIVVHLAVDDGTSTVDTMIAAIQATPDVAALLQDTTGCSGTAVLANRWGPSVGGTEFSGGEDAPDFFFGLQGTIDDFRFYDAALLPDAVLELSRPMRGPVTASPGP